MSNQQQPWPRSERDNLLHNTNASIQCASDLVHRLQEIYRSGQQTITQDDQYMASYRTQISDLTQQAANSREEIEDLETRLIAAELQRDAAKTDANEAKTDANEAKTVAEKTQLELEATKSELEAVKAELTSVSDELLSANNDLDYAKERLESAYKEVDDLRRRKQLYSDAVDLHIGTNLQKDETIKRLQGVIAAMDRMRTNAKQLAMDELLDKVGYKRRRTESDDRTDARNN